MSSPSESVDRKKFIVRALPKWLLASSFKICSREIVVGYATQGLYVKIWIVEKQKFIELSCEDWSDLSEKLDDLWRFMSSFGGKDRKVDINHRLKARIFFCKDRAYDVNGVKIEPMHSLDQLYITMESKQSGVKIKLHYDEFKELIYHRYLLNYKIAQMQSNHPLFIDFFNEYINKCMAHPVNTVPIQDVLIFRSFRSSNMVIDCIQLAYEISHYCNDEIKRGSIV